MALYILVKEVKEGEKRDAYEILRIVLEHLVPFGVELRTFHVSNDGKVYIETDKPFDAKRLNHLGLQLAKGTLSVEGSLELDK